MNHVDYILATDAKGEDMAWPPTEIDLGDGRVIMLREWRPCAIHNEILSVTLEGIIARKRKPSSRTRPLKGENAPPPIDERPFPSPSPRL